MTRGIRNNNPLNIRLTNTDWQGCVAHSNNTDGAFEQFIIMEYGFRAALKIIETYIIEHECNTIRAIISRWAPPTENNTEKYIRYVCGKTGVGGNEPLSINDKRLKEIVWAMAQMESGKGILEYKSSLDKAFDAFEPREVYVKERKKIYT